MNMRSRWMAAVAAAMVAACGGGGGGAEVSATAGQGTLRMALTDAPSCGYDHVYVTVDRVRVHQSSGAADADGGWREIALPAPRRLDLLTLTNGVMEELGQTTLPAGRYTQVRLVLAENTAANPLANAVHPTGAAEVALRTPSGQQSGLKLQTRFDVPEGGMADLLLDFDACRSVVKAGNSGNYNLKPVLSVTPRLSTGILGYVTTTLTIGSTTVSAQQDGQVIRSTVPDATGRFVLPSLQAGSYDVVVTSEGRSTAVVTSVPVTATASTTLNGTATSIAPPPSDMREISGTASTPAGTATTATVLVTDADVRALQSISGGPTVQVRQVPVDATTATYTLRLPAAAPVRAPYAAGGSLSFTADGTAAGKYRLQASALGRTTVQRDADIGTSGQTVNFSFSP
jgi:hypothetical protein